MAFLTESKLARYTERLWANILDKINANKTTIDTTLTQEGQAADAKTVGDTIAQLLEAASITLKSSSEGSSKRFKLEIDDNGVLSATEIIE